MKIQLLISAVALGMVGNVAQASYRLNLSSALNAQDPIVQAMEGAKQAIEERSGGELTINVYPNSQLGSDEDVIEQIRNGANIAVLVDAGRLSEYQADIGVLSAPYLVEEQSEYRYITESELYQGWTEEMAGNSGLRLLNFNWFQGAREMLTQNEVNRPEDLQGVRVRTINSPVWTRTVEAMGARAAPMPWSEVYSALQLGAVDGAEIQLTAAASQRLQEVITHAALTSHIQLVTGLATSEQWYQSLPDDLRQILDEELLAAGDAATAGTLAALKTARETMESAGVTFNEVDIGPFRERVDSIYEELGYSELRAEISALIDAGKAAVDK